jgi:hypothetical protein
MIQGARNSHKGRTEPPGSGQLEREYKDLDFAVPKRGGPPASKLLRDEGYEPEVAFNAIHGQRRMLFQDLEHGRQIDVFVGSFHICHEIPFSGRLSPGHATVPLAELVLTKLQIVELNEKDVRDTLLLFHAHEVADHDEDAVNAARMAELCANDWGLWRTITGNVTRCREHVTEYSLPESQVQLIEERLSAVLEKIEEAPKSRRWWLRAKVGERKRWYDLPEQVDP